ncbi:MAG: SDR family oxidoreductase [Cytophagaceae bacterium]|nr:SDR family oxidoreductase [Cytophagaceae bacterium]MBK9508171.1 SDR family oxidoreductase [Cytophagaceae bacterium]MBK9936566.1 SDR family oxidoreductase [Cytophagaceae bacterium]MBL0300321.1 SDR family oxidoreductase [Cytophagaceae bacterium]MBL0327253.1 SDR family oxidoreductase [Cytophagaceae bacterium]
MHNNYLIIGGSSGIGKATSEILSSGNHQVFASYFKKNPEVSGVKYFYLNVLDTDYDWASLPEIVHGLVYCPGSINLKPFSRISPEDFINDYNFQVLGFIKIFKAILPRLKMATQSSVVVFSTVAVQQGFPFHSLVSSSKGAIEGLVKALAAEFAPQIRINAIAPSLTNTPLAGNILNTPEKIQANDARHPMKRIGQPTDIAEMVAFLLSDKSSWITGQIFHVDGGISSIKN